MVRKTTNRNKAPFEISTIDSYKELLDEQESTLRLVRNRVKQSKEAIKLLRADKSLARKVREWAYTECMSVHDFHGEKEKFNKQNVELYKEIKEIVGFENARFLFDIRLLEMDKIFNSP